ncbi:hypothetical protein SAMN05216428_10161 [Nitrosospira sp. Nsp11]|uniref:hypothetical protein n=1 Tax=Nitrosospira sp. Nsp11 TaxID=1855338 RepID=UPI0009203087|nr:hypothetical protein [Nitrosospira sp. Nsp11]SHL09685.1 hypothetical protein SAMN05216428_10161 [Nitrosospira sp. Nsp11]
MKKLNLHDIYTFSKALYPMSTLKVDMPIQPQLFNLWSAREALVAMLKEGSPLLGTARRAATKLLEHINKVMPQNLEKLFDEEEKQDIGYNAELIKRSLNDLESVLGNDMPGIAAYLVSQKGIYNTDDLINNAENYFPAEVRDVLPHQACIDLREAGRCLAYELATACVFHLWRAVEGVMLSYFHQLTKKPWEANNKNWAAYIRALKDAGADEKITVFLDHIRTEYRNPQTHPETNVDILEAQQLFGAAMSLINQMLKAIKSLQAETLSTLLPPPRSNLMIPVHN